MRRMEQVRISDWAVRTLVTLTFFSFFFLPKQWMFPLMFVNLVAVGIWLLLYPEGVLGWLRTAQPALDSRGFVNLVGSPPHKFLLLRLGDFGGGRKLGLNRQYLTDPGSAVPNAYYPLWSD
jgi:hypothetical protein